MRLNHNSDDLKSQLELERDRGKNFNSILKFLQVAFEEVVDYPSHKEPARENWR